jgi:hypothetical protein
MSFADALYALWGGKRVCRSGWNGKGMWLLLIENYQVGFHPDLEGMKMLPWIGMKTANGGFVPWLASQTDILASDWEALE